MASTSPVQLFLALAIIVLTAKVAGYISRRLGQPAVLGELIVGLILGPSVLNLLSHFDDPRLGDIIQAMADIGVLLLIFNAGLEIELDELRRVGRAAFYSAGLGQFVSIVVVLPVAWLWVQDGRAALFIAMMLAPTSISISAQTMLEMKVIRTREGIALLGAAVIDDITAIILLSLLIAFSLSGAGLPQVAGIVMHLILFSVVALVIGWLLLPWLANRIASLDVTSGALAFAIVVAMLYGWAAETFGGMAAITGAFIAGMCLSRTHGDTRREMADGLHSLSYGLFAPLFFINIGLHTDLGQVGLGIIPVALLILGVAIAAKVFGAGIGAKLSGFDRQSALRVGAGMVARGEVGLIIGTEALQAHLISATVFSVIVLVIMATALVTPPLLRWAFDRRTPVAVQTQSGS